MNKIKDIYPLSTTQEAILAQSLINTKANPYTATSIIYLGSNINIKHLKNTWGKITQIYPVLRTGFNWEEANKPIQFVLEKAKIDWYELDWSHLSINNFKSELQLLSHDVDFQSFNIKKPPLARMILVKNINNELYLVWIVHHLILDGWSQGIILNNFFSTYCGSNTRTFSAPEFKAFIQWGLNQNRMKTNQFWKDTLSNYESSHFVDVISNININAVQTQQQAKYSFEFTQGETHHIKSTAKLYQTSIYNVMLAAWSICISRISLSNKIIIGIVDSGRQIDIEDIYQIAGVLINTVPLAVQLNNDLQVHQLIKHISELTVALYEHSYIGLRSILAAANKSSNQPLIDHLFIMQNQPDSLTTFENDFNPIPISTHETTEFPLVVTILPEEILSVSFAISHSLKSEQIQILANSYKNILLQMLNNSHTSLKSLFLASKQDIDFIKHINATNHIFPNEITLNEAVEIHCTKSPNSIAISFADQLYDYYTINSSANQIAHYLQDTGIKPNDVIAVSLPRSADFVICLLGILKLGCSYLPIAKDLPEIRKEFMLNDSDSRLLITEDQQIDSQSISIKELMSHSRQYPKHNMGRCANNTNAAYIIYTSGSTGQPKGVIINHISIMNRLTWMEHYLSITPNDRILHKTSISFDVSVWEIFLPLMCGARLVITPDNYQKDPSKLINIINSQQCNIAHFVPSMILPFFDYVDENDCKSLKTIVTSGESLLPIHVSAIKTKLDARIYNLYGPTEATIDVTAHECSLNDTIVPIGKPIWNTRLYILDQCQKLLPIGCEGELYIAGINVGSGYINQSKLTRSTFVNLELFEQEFEYLYKTGDLVRLNSDLTFEFISRIDNQIKLRGYRIELGEIEAALFQLVEVKEAAVICHASIHFQRLAAFITLRNKITINDIKIHLNKLLPDYMVPERIIILESLPLSSSGKLSKTELIKYLDIGSVNVSNRPPLNGIEQSIVNIWKTLFKATSISCTDNFFALGGDSITAIYCSSLAKANGLGISVNDIFKFPVLEDLAKNINYVNQPLSYYPTPINQSIPLSPIAKWFFKRNLLNPHYFNQAILLSSEIELNFQSLIQTFKEIFKRHDCFRYRYIKQDSKWKQICISENDPENNIYIENFIIDDEAQFKNKMNSIANDLHKKINISSGPLFIAALVNVKNNFYLLLISHHLIIDIFSWSILIKNIQLIYEVKEKVLMNNDLQTYAAWIYYQIENFTNKRNDADLRFWKSQQSQSLEPTICLDIKSFNSIPNPHKLSLVIDENTTKHLLKKVNLTTSLFIQDLLLSAIYLTLSKYSGRNSINIWIEAHGRNSIKNFDCSEIIGWFTSLYPVSVSISDVSDLKEVFNKITDIHNEILQHHTSYGLLRYIGNKKIPDPPYEIVLNYLGNVTQNQQNNWLQLCKENHTGIPVDSNNQLLIGHTINAYIENNELFITWEFDSSVHHISKLNKFLESMKNYIIELIELQSTTVYKLLPLQTGLFINHLKQSDNIYLIQNSYSITGNVCVERFKAAWCNAYENFYALRASFTWNESGANQSIRNYSPHDDFSVRFHECSTDVETDTIINIILSKCRSEIKDLSKAPLMQLDLIKNNANHYIFIWQHHHILLDGWSITLIWHYILNYYNNAKNPSYNTITEVDKYLEYVNWINSLDSTESTAFWKHYISNIEDPCFISSIQSHSCNLPKVIKSYNFTIDYAKSFQLRQLSSDNNLTLNAMIQTLWCYIVGTYTDKNTMSFGVIHSGRTNDFPGVENIVGLLINTLPFKFKIDLHQSFLVHASSIQNDFAEINKYGFLSLSEIIKSKNIQANSLLDHLYIFENYPDPIDANNSCNEIQIKPINIINQTDYPFVITVVPNSTIDIQITVDSSLIAVELINSIVSSLTLLVDKVIDNPNTTFSELALLSPNDKSLLKIINPMKINISYGPLNKESAEKFVHSRDTIALNINPLNSNTILKTKSALENLIIRYFSDIFNGPFSVDSNFFEIGGNSLDAMRILYRLSKSLNASITFRLLFQNPKICDFAKAIQNEMQLSSEWFHTKINKIVNNQPYFSSFAQERLWILNNLLDHPEIYNITFNYKINGIIDKIKFINSLENTIKIHPILKTIFSVDDNGNLIQLVREQLPHKSLLIEWIDISDKTTSEKNALINDHINMLYSFHFNLSEFPLFKFRVLQLSDELHILIGSIHHILVDAHSLKIFFDDWVSHYNNQKTKAANPSALNYLDYANWQRELFIDGKLTPQLHYWKKTLNDYPNSSTLITDYQRSLKSNRRATSIQLTMPSDVTNQIKQFASFYNKSLFTFFISIYVILLSRFSKQSDLIIGTPITNRPHPDLFNVIGLFMNTLPLRFTLNTDTKFLEFLSLVSQLLCDAYDNQNLPFEKLLDELKLYRSLNKHPLFQTMFVFHSKAEDINPTFNELEFQRLDSDIHFSKFDVMFKVYEELNHFHTLIIYDESLYDKKTIQSFCDAFFIAVKHLIANPHIQLNNFSLIDLNYFINKQLLDPSFENPSIHVNNLADIFFQSAAFYPGKIAIVQNDTQITYDMLATKAKHIREFINFNCFDSKSIAIIGKNSIEFIIAIIGTLAANKIFVPIDADMPPERIKSMLAISDVKLILSTNDFSNKLIVTSILQKNISELLTVDLSQKNIVDCMDLKIEPLAYYIFTSGSTGSPKAIAINHLSVINYIASIRERLKIENYHTFSFNTTLSADLSYTSLFAGLFSGNTTYLITHDMNSNADRFFSFINSNQIDFLKTTPSFIDAMLDSNQLEQPLSIKTLILGGEPLTSQIVNKIWANNKLLNIVNHYGPTETTIGILTYTLDQTAVNYSRIPIGKPLRHVNAIVVDDYDNLSPVGSIGRLLIAGQSIGQGYLGTNTDLEPLPTHILTNEIKYYDTGDLVRQRFDGQIEFIGRNDTQNKIRGFRIDTQEITQLLQHHGDVSQAYTLIKNNAHSIELISFYTPGEFVPSELELKSYLNKYLPQHMRPSHLILLEEFPLTINHKIDTRMLQSIFDEHFHSKAKYFQPLNDIEYKLTSLWEKKLNLSLVDTQTDFFSHGGNSLLALSLVNEINKKFNSKIVIADLFNYPTIRSLAPHILKPSIQAVFPIQVDLSEKNLYIIHPGSGLSFCYLPLKSFIKGINIYGINNPYFLKKTYHAKTIHELADIYAEQIFENTKDKTIDLAGWSFGGLVATELANVLQRKYQITVTNLILFDTFCPGETLTKVATHLPANTKQLLLKEQLIDDGIDIKSNEAKAIIACIEESKLLSNQYVPKLTQSTTTVYLVKATQNNFVNAVDFYYGWKSIFKTVRILNIETDHNSLFNPENIEEISTIIENCVNGSIKSRYAST